MSEIKQPFEVIVFTQDTIVLQKVYLATDCQITERLALAEVVAGNTTIDVSTLTIKAKGF